MTEAVQLAIIIAVPNTLIAITGLIAVLPKLRRIEKQTNGNLSQAQAKNDLAQKLMPELNNLPENATVKVTMSVDDHSNTEAPKVTETVTRLEKP